MLIVGKGEKVLPEICTEVEVLRPLVHFCMN